MENHDILTNACAALDRYRDEERLLEAEVTIAQTRLELVREFISALSGKPKVRRKPSKVADIAGENRSNIAEMPQRVPGGIAEVPTQPDLVA